MSSARWPIRKLEDTQVCLLNPKKSEIAKVPDSTQVSFVPMSQVDDISGVMAISTEKPLGEVRKGYTYFAEGDVVFAKITPCMENGKSAIARGLKNKIGFGTTEFHVLRPGPLVLAEWLHLFVRQGNFREEAKKNMHGAAGQQRVPVDFLKEADIPVPPLPEQRRIVARIEELTQRTEEARKLRQEAIASISAEFFHVRRKIFEKLSAECPTKHLSECGEVIGGGTPSKQCNDYWDGDIPWISAKDMKSFELKDSGLKITSKGLTESSAKMIPKNSVLFVVRGSILYRYVPVAVNTMPCTINQDLKAIVPHSGIDAIFLAHMLWGANDKLQDMVEEAGNTAGKLPTPSWASFEVPIPDPTTQEAVIEELGAFQEKLIELGQLQAETAEELASFQSALLAKAFRGEL
jgi:type I restriction enzyme S subunit